MKNYAPQTFGTFLDLSRNAVMSIPAFKEYLVYLSKMGYNCLYFYNEDCYEIPEEPHFGYLRGRYTIAEMKELDAFANGLGIEIVPCIQTLAHLRSYSRWKKASFEVDDTLMVDDPRTYELVENMIKTVSECFTTRRIHIGMDEARELGRGRHLDKYGYESSAALLKRHLEKVNEIVKKYGCHAIVWSDMFIGPWNKGYYIPANKGVQTVPKEYIEAVPKDVELVYWDYYHDTKEHFLKHLKTHQQFNSEIWFAGAVWNWRSLVPNNHYSIHTMVPAFEACRELDIKHIVLTTWGDNGCECSRFGNLPSLLYLAEYIKGNTDEEKIKAKFKRIFGMEYDAFMRLDEPDFVHFGHNSTERASKRILFSDPFVSYLDAVHKDGQDEIYASLADEYRKYAKKSRKWGYVFDAHAKMCAVFATKYSLGVKTRAAYKNGDKSELLRLAKEDYTLLYKQLNEYLAAFRKQWYTENKPFGFDVQEIRIGGIITRVDSCKKRLIAYCKGEINEIPELAEELLPLRSNESLALVGDYDIIATPSTLWGIQ